MLTGQSGWIAANKDLLRGTLELPAIWIITVPLMPELSDRVFGQLRQDVPSGDVEITAIAVQCVSPFCFLMQILQDILPEVLEQLVLV